MIPPSIALGSWTTNNSTCLIFKRFSMLPSDRRQLIVSYHLYKYSPPLSSSSHSFSHTLLPPSCQVHSSPSPSTVSQGQVSNPGRSADQPDPPSSSATTRSTNVPPEEGSPRPDEGWKQDGVGASLWLIVTMQADAVLGRSSRQRIMSFRHVLPNSAVPSRGTFRSEWWSAPSSLLDILFGRGQC